VKPLDIMANTIGTPCCKTMVVYILLRQIKFISICNKRYFTSHWNFICFL